MKYVVEWNAQSDPVQVEVEADGPMDAITKALWLKSSRGPNPEPHPDYEGWQKVEFSLLPGGHPAEEG